MIVNSPSSAAPAARRRRISLAPAAVEIAIQEMGHAAFGLADEYEYFTGCASGEAGHNTHPNTEPTEPNITVETDRTKLKWRHLVDAATAIPTGTPTARSAIRRQTLGRRGHRRPLRGRALLPLRRVRPSYDCRMRTFGCRTARCARTRSATSSAAAPNRPASSRRRTSRRRPSRRRGAAKLARRTPRAGARGRRAMAALMTVYERVGPPRRPRGRPRTPACYGFASSRRSRVESATARGDEPATTREFVRCIEIRSDHFKSAAALAAPRVEGEPARSTEVRSRVKHARLTDLPNRGPLQARRRGSHGSPASPPRLP